MGLGSGAIIGAGLQAKTERGEVPMPREEFAYWVTTEKAVPEAVAAVEAKAAEKGFRVLGRHDVATLLREKGFERSAMQIVEICGARYAHRVLAADNLTSIFLPCPIRVYEEDGRTVIATMRPTAIEAFFPHSDLGGVPEEVEAIVRSIVDEAAAPER
jgi:uncharacterized protein (DUF302 family)